MGCWLYIQLFVFERAGAKKHRPHGYGLMDHGRKGSFRDENFVLYDK